MRKLKMKRFLGSVLMVLGLSGSAWGYGLDGFADSTEFSNLLGKYPVYAYWAYEGGDSGLWSRDNHGNDQMSAYDPSNFSSDNDILSHDANEIGGNLSTGMYRPFNEHYYVPHGATNNWFLLGSDTNDGDGFTVEWRVRLDPNGTNSSTTWGLVSRGYYFGFRVEECPDLSFRLGGTNAADSVAHFPALDLDFPLADATEWHTYRFTVLGNDGSGAIRANFYQDSTLIAEELQVGVADNFLITSNHLWNGTEWGGDIAGGTHNHQIDYVRIDSFGAYAPIPENCGDEGTVYQSADTNNDCLVDLYDFADVSEAMGRCSDPANPACESIPWIYEDFTDSVWNPTNADVAPMVDGNTNGWDITHGGTIWPGGVVYSENASPANSACLRGNANEVGFSQITRDIGAQTAGSVSFAYTTGYSPMFGGRLSLRAFNTDVMTLRFGTEWSGSAWRGFIETDPNGTANPNDPVEILTTTQDLASSFGSYVKFSFDFDANGIFNIDVHSDTQVGNAAQTSAIPFEFPVPFIDQIRFVGIASTDFHTPADTTVYNGSVCFGRGDGEGIGIDIPKSVCGDFGTGYFDGDITGPLTARDCYVNLLDASQLFAQWLSDTEGQLVILPIIPQGSVTVDGDLSEWGASTIWTPLDQVYFGLPNDMPSGKFALRWDSGTNKIYAAVEIEDTTHWFTDTYSADNASDRIEIYCQGDNAGGMFTTDYDEAQQYMVGNLDAGPGNWATWGNGDPIEPNAVFDSATSVSGDTITYEIQVTPFNFYGTKVSAGFDDPTVMAVGSIVRFDLIADTRWGVSGSSFGIKSANLMLGKFEDADQIQQYELGN